MNFKDEYWNHVGYLESEYARGDEVRCWPRSWVIMLGLRKQHLLEEERKKKVGGLARLKRLRRIRRLAADVRYLGKELRRRYNPANK